MCRRRKRQVDSYRSYLRRVLTSVHPDLGISAKAMEILNSMTHDMYERITTEAARLLRITGAPFSWMPLPICSSPFCSSCPPSPHLCTLWCFSSASRSQHLRMLAAYGYLKLHLATDKKCL